MKTSIKTLAFVVAAAAFTACSAPTIDPVRPAQPATSIVMPATPAQPQPIDKTLDDEQPATDNHAKLPYAEMSDSGSQQPATVGNPAPHPIPRPAYQQPSHKPAQLTAVSDSLM